VTRSRLLLSRATSVGAHLSRGTILRATIVALLVTLVAGAGTAIAMDKRVTVQVDGESVALSTMSSNVTGALGAAGLSVGEHDTLAPAAGAPISDGDTIVLRRARPLTLTVDGQQRQVWTTALTVDEAMQQLGLDSTDSTVSASRSQRLPLDGMALEVQNLRFVSIDDGGTITGVRTPAATVGELLADRGLTLEQGDTASADAASPVTAMMRLSITRIRTSDVAEDQPIAPPEQKVDDPTLAQGQTAVQTPGVAGTQRVTYRVTTTNGVESARQPLAVTVTTPPQPTVTKVGTKPAPAPAAAPAATAAAAPAAAGSSNTGAAAPSVANSSDFDRLAQCESGGNWAINTGNGFYGGVQFDRGTWLGNGGGAYAPLPNQATREQQIDIASRVQAARGWSPWPSCSRTVGLR
jgi:uncharacterized protein YabE (DUF348 family)